MEKNTSIRLDKWLWACRFFKTRALARQAIEGGKVEFNGAKAKPGKTVTLNSHIKLKNGYDIREVVVTLLSDKRGSATIAQTLYRETENSLRLREKNASDRKLASQVIQHGQKKPDKHQRRNMKDFKRFPSD